MGVREYARIVSNDFSLDVNEWFGEMKSYKYIEASFASQEAKFDAFVWLDDNIGDEDYLDLIVHEKNVSTTYFFFTHYQDLIQFKLACL
jgi:hypothetical protein